MNMQISYLRLELILRTWLERAWQIIRSLKSQRQVSQRFWMSLNKLFHLTLSFFSASEAKFLISWYHMLGVQSYQLCLTSWTCHHPIVSAFYWLPFYHTFWKSSKLDQTNHARMQSRNFAVSLNTSFNMSTKNCLHHYRSLRRLERFLNKGYTDVWNGFCLGSYRLKFPPSHSYFGGGEDIKRHHQQLW